MKSEKAIISAKDYGSNTDLENQLTMNKFTANQAKFQLPTIGATQNTSRRDLLEQSKLSRLPQRVPFRLPDFDNTPTTPVAVVVVCAGCGGRLETDNEFQKSIRACRKCLSHYARIEAAIDEASKRKRREMLEKFAGGVK